MKRILVLLLPLLIVFAIAIVKEPSASAERPRVYALKDARIVVEPGKIIPKGNVIIRDGVIAAAGANVPIPPDAEEIDVAGKTVYAGFIDASTNVGLRRSTTTTTATAGRGGNQIAALLAAQTSPAQAAPGANHPIARVHPEMEARNLLVPFEPPATATTAPAAGAGGGGAAGGAGAGAAAQPQTEAERYRNIGFTTVLVEPDSGIFRGTDAIINLRDSTPVTQLIVKDGVAQHIALEMRGGFGGGGGAYPGSLMGVIASIRQAFLDTQRYQVWKQRYAAHPEGMKRLEYSPSFEALLPVIGGESLVVFDTEAGEDILAASRIAHEFNLHKIVMGADTNTFEMVDRVAAVKCPLILSAAMPEKPRLDDADEAAETDTRELRRFVDAPTTAKKLYDLKVQFVLSTRGIRNVADFPHNVKRMIDAGLPTDAALAALTTGPAKLLGVQSLMGTVEKGKLANVIVTDGDLFLPNTHILRIFVDGYEYMGPPIPNRQNAPPRPPGEPIGGTPREGDAQ